MTDERNDALQDAFPDEPSEDFGFEDDDLSALFDAFDDVHATEQLKEATLDRIATDARPLHVDRANRSGSRRRAKLRVIRVAAVAACLVLALTGGVAYATPTSHVSVVQGETAIELGVNCFGFTVAASSDDETGQTIVSDTSLRNLPYEEALDRTLDALYASNAEEAVSVIVDAGEGGQREQLEGQSADVMEKHAPDPSPAPTPEPEPKPDADPAAAPQAPDDALAGQQPNPLDSPSQPDDAPQSPNTPPAPPVNPA